MRPAPARRGSEGGAPAPPRRGAPPPEPGGGPAAGEGPPPEEGRDVRYWRRRRRELPPLRAVGYRSKGEAFNGWMYRARARSVEAVLDRILEGVPAGSVRVLDVGSGTGFFVELWARRRELGGLVGVDVSPEAVAALRSRFPRWAFHVAEVGGAAPLPVGGSFDVVQAMDVLYHVTDDGRFRRGLGELGRRVRPGGRLLVTDNFPDRAVTTRPHVRLRPLGEYLAVLEGFRVEAVVPQFLFLNVPSGVARPAVRWPLVVAWEALTLPARLDAVGGPLGALLYALDRLLLPAVGLRTPSTKLAVLRKGGEGEG